MYLSIFLGGSGLLPTFTNFYTEPVMETAQKVIQEPQIIQYGQTLGQQIVTASLTTLGAVLVYVVGQILTKFIIDPIHDQKQIIGEIADALIFYGNKYHYWNQYQYSPWDDEANKRVLEHELSEKEKTDQIYDNIRRLGTVLIAKTHMIPFYNFWSVFHLVKPIDSIVIAKKSLIALSNNVTAVDRNVQKDHELKIRESLGIFNPD